MAFKRVQIAQNTDTPFFDDWEKTLSVANKEVLSNLILAPTYTKAVKSGKGYIVSFSDEFIVFAWKNSSTGKFIKELIANESGSLPLIQFGIKGFKLTYDFGQDDEYEIELITDEDDDTPYTINITSEKPPISPNENRSSIFELPKLTKPPALSATAKKSKVKSLI